MLPVGAARDAAGSGLLPDEFLARRPTVAHSIARFVAGQGVQRVYSLPGGHIKPIWDELDRAGVRIVSTRHEGAAVHMAQAEADLTSSLAVAIVTTGPGLTNAVSAIACADLARSHVLVISARPPRAQTGMGALEEIPQAEVVGTLTRSSIAVADARQVLPKLDFSVARAVGVDGIAGPVYIDFPTDLLGETTPPPYSGDLAFRRRAREMILPSPASVDTAAALVRDARRPLIIGGPEVRQDVEAVAGFIEETGSLYLDTRASRGMIDVGRAFVPAVRARAMAEADLVLTLGRDLDFELAYGSPAIFTNASTWIRVGRSVEELSKNRRPDVEVHSDVGPALNRLLESGATPVELDEGWTSELIARNLEKEQVLREQLKQAPREEGGLHPFAVFAVLNEYIDDQTVVVVDGGDTLAFARVGLKTPTYLDLGAFGCLGVGLPFANAAKLVFPGRRVLAVIGDGSFGFHALELETAVREGIDVTAIVMNNSAWNIERYDQIVHYDGRVLGTELSHVSYAMMAKALGADGEKVGEVEDLRPALDQAFANGPAVVDVAVSREPVSPDSKTGLATVPALQALEPWEEAERAWLENTDNKEVGNGSGYS